jgi:DNA mismatch repair protein MSH6
VSANKDTHQLEVPDRLASRVPPGWHKASTRKGFTRFTCPALEALKARAAAAADRREKALAGVLTALSRRAARRARVWAAAADAAAELDALCSLAVASHEMAASGPVCTPRVLPPPLAGAPRGAHALAVTALRHPCAPALTAGGGATGGAGGFVPNDTSLGGTSAPMLLLTGPNMGGKSTLLRQVCLAALLAHIGADVPAESMTLHAVDALFVRMGARDSLATGQSTFALELGEAGAMLRRATAASLVACDELGRGTATHDGAAIAHATLGYLAATCAPRTLFSTHYHRLAAAAKAHPGVVSLGHMGCRVAPASDAGGGSGRGREEVTFLYKLRPGACPKSYGVNVARLAGLPERVLAAAAARAAALEETCGEADADADADDADGGAGGGVSPALSDAEAAALMAAVAAAAGGDGDALAAAAAAARAATAARTAATEA